MGDIRARREGEGKLCTGAKTLWLEWGCVMGISPLPVSCLFHSIYSFPRAIIHMYVYTYRIRWDPSLPYPSSASFSSSFIRGKIDKYSPVSLSLIIKEFLSIKKN